MDFPITYGHVLIALPVASDDVVALRPQTLGQVRGDESTSPSNADPELLRRPVRLEGELGELGGLVVIGMNASGRSHLAKVATRIWLKLYKFKV